MRALGLLSVFRVQPPYTDKKLVVTRSVPAFGTLPVTTYWLLIARTLQFKHPLPTPLTIFATIFYITTSYVQC